MKEIVSALIEVQKEVCNPIKGKQNPFLKNKYADINSVIEAIKPMLNNHGLIILQPINTRDGKNYIQTIILHESGESVESWTEIIFNQGSAQSFGSGVTYARRYSLQSILCIGADDDDGNAASNKNDFDSMENHDIMVATDSIRRCLTRDDLFQVWANYPHLHNNNSVRNEFTTRSEQINKQ